MCAGSHQVPFMADEAMQAIPGLGKVDYTVKFYLKYLDKIRSCLENLMKKGKYISKLKLHKYASTKKKNDWLFLQLLINSPDVA